MGKVTEDWSVSEDLCCPLGLDRDRLDCETALLKHRTTAELQDNLVLCYLRMPLGGYPESQHQLVRQWRQILIDELTTRKPIHWRPWLAARLARVFPKPSLANQLVQQETHEGLPPAK